MLSIDIDSSAQAHQDHAQPFHPVYSASAEDVNDVFGQEDATHFHVGAPLELEHTQDQPGSASGWRSAQSASSAKAAPAKASLPACCWPGSSRAMPGVSLIFDMHNDYGWEINS